MTAPHTSMTKGKASRDGLKRLHRLIVAARLALFVEDLVPALVFPLAIASLLPTVAWTGLLFLLADWLRLAVLVLWAAALIWFARGLFRLEWPTQAAALKRLEDDSALAHQPLVSLLDHPARDMDDALTRALWQVHRDRALAALGKVRLSLPQPQTNRRDPYAVRFACLMALFIAAFFAARDPIGPLLDAFSLPQSPAAPVRVDAYVTPPAYTGRRPVVLNAEHPLALVPDGSRLDIRVSGHSGVEARLSADKGPVLELPASQVSAGHVSSSAFTAVLDHSARLSIRAGERELAGYDLTVVMDRPPQVALAGEPEVSANGTLHLTYVVEDDYGVVSAGARFALPVDGGNGGRSLYEPPGFALPVPRPGPGKLKGESWRDLTSHPLAGARLDLVLAARDARGQESEVNAGAVTLPERLFQNPLARALVEQRRRLAMDAHYAGPLRDVLELMLRYPQGHIPDARTYLGLADALALLRHPRAEDDLREVVDRLWQIAIALDGAGAVTDAAEALRKAREALHEALARGASPEEIARLADQARKALDAYMRALASQPHAPNTAKSNTPARILKPQDLQKMLDRIDELSRLGDRQAAEKLLSELDKALENLQSTTSQQEQAGGESPGDKAMNALSDMISRQQQLRQQTWREGQKTRQGEDTDPAGPPDPPGNGQPSDAMKTLEQGQRALKDQLGKALDQMRQLGMEPDEALKNAMKSMEDAANDLQNGDPGQASGDQGSALDQLRQGAQAMASRMGKDGQQGPGRGQGKEGGPDNDPLGRSSEGRANPDGNGVKVPDEFTIERTRRILDELRRRSGERDRPQPELDYLDRLLKAY